jgi:hypothetical protein
MRADGARRLELYCRQAAVMPSDWVDRPYRDLWGRERIRHRVRYVNRELRGLVWSDAEVRGVLLAAGKGTAAFDALVSAVAGANPFDLLDLVTAMSLEAEVRAERAGV